MAGGKIKLAEQAISVILIADTDSKSGDEAGNVEEYFKEEEKVEEEEEEQHLLVEQTNVYYQQQAGPSHRLPDVTLPDMMTFVALAPQMGHKLKDTLHDYWSRLKQLHSPFYGQTMARDRILHILHFMHFAHNSQRPDKGEEYDRL
jgi:hypothetical protein